MLPEQGILTIMIGVPLGAMTAVLRVILVWQGSPLTFIFEGKLRTQQNLNILCLVYRAQ